MCTRRHTPALKYSVSRVLFPPPVTLGEAVFIRLGMPLPTPSSSPPEALGRAAHCPQFDLALAGVYLADPVSRVAGGLLLHRFDLTRDQSPAGPVRPRTPDSRGWWRVGAGANPEGFLAVCFLLHLPSCHHDRALPGNLLYSARTFLPHCPPKGTPPANTWSTSAAPL